MTMRAAPLLAVLALVACRRPPASIDDDSGESSTGAESSPSEGAGPRDHMHLETNNLSKDVWMKGWASIPHPPHREYAYAGPLGCAGQRFKTKLTKHIRLDIGYTAQKAFVIVGEAPYVLSKPPVVEGKTLVWSGNFTSSEDGSTRWFRLRIDCPLPAK